MNLKKKKLSSAFGGISDLIKPQMTSLIDILTLLLVFLIQSFNAEGTLITPSSDLVLPSSSSKKQPSPSIMLEVTRDGVVAEGKQLAENKSFAGSADLLVTSVYDWLARKKNRSSATAEQKRIIIQCDRDIEFNIVKRVMYTCSKAGFTDFSVLVIEE
jgi:biopolymer transport protein ExbD